MDTFGHITIGKNFKFHGGTYTKIDETTGVSIGTGKQKVKFFTVNQVVDIDI